ncbi:MAG: CAP domain-containing protein [Myxococcales bacterium]|nr:CAP domain-containing protein [Myxococcales bacterium]
MSQMSLLTQRALTLLAITLIACGSDGVPPGTSLECDGETSEVCEVFRIVNMERASAGLAPYTWNAELAIAAQLHAIDMDEQGYFSHDSQDGRSFAQRATAAGYDGRPAGENIARGQRSPEQVMSSWMGSDGHRRNILSSSSNEIGVGLQNFHWVQVFGRR